MLGKLFGIQEVELFAMEDDEKQTLSRRIAALLLVVTVGITALAPAASAANIQLPSLPKDQCVVDDAVC